METGVGGGGLLAAFSISQTKGDTFHPVGGGETSRKNSHQRRRVMKGRSLETRAEQHPKDPEQTHDP